MMMQVLAMKKENRTWTDEEIKHWLAGESLSLYRLYGTASCHQSLAVERRGSRMKYINQPL